jgi:hypothetical protein
MKIKGPHAGHRHKPTKLYVYLIVLAHSFPARFTSNYHSDFVNHPSFLSENNHSFSDECSFTTAEIMEQNSSSNLDDASSSIPRKLLDKIKRLLGVNDDDQSSGHDSSSSVLRGGFHHGPTKSAE